MNETFIILLSNFQDNLNSTLIMDHVQQKVIAPTPLGGVLIANSIPRVVGHTDNGGYAFMFENTITDQR